MRDVGIKRMARAQPHRQGLVAVTMIVLLMIVDLIIVSLVISGTRDHDLTVRRLQTVEAFYAAEAGVNMSIRELMVPGDEDGDGVTGTISYENNPGPYDPDNDPILGNAQFYVLGTDPVTTLTSEGRSGEARRTMTAELTP